MMDVPAFDARKIVRSALGALALYFSIIVVSLMTMTRIASAAAVDAVSPISGGNRYYCYTYSGLQASNLADFQAVINAQWPPGGWYTLGAQGVADSGQCGNYNADGTQHAQYSAAWYSVPAVCPTPVSGAAYTFNDKTGLCERPVQDVCPVSDLPPITDPAVQFFEGNDKFTDIVHLTPRMQAALSCLLSAAVNGTPSVTPSVGSAYRPPAYNQHLIDVWDKWKKELMNEHRPECQTLRAKIEEHFNHHKMVRRPDPHSAHTRGEAFDLTSSLPYANLDALAGGCQVYRNNPSGDRVHFIHR